MEDMKITAVKPYIVGNGRNLTFVKVETDTGIYGVGEAGITWKELAVAGAMDHLGELIIGEDPMRTEHIWQVMLRGAFFPGGKVVSSAMSAIDIALWDIKGKVLDQPVYNLLGGLVRQKAVCYPHIGGSTPEQIAENARKIVDEGWKFVRFGLSDETPNILEPSRAVRSSIKRFEAIRKAVGDDIEICIDIHTRLDPPHTVALCRGLEPFRPFFLEDPLRSENTSSFHNLRKHVAAPIAAGEHYATKWEFRELVEEDLIDYARIDLCIVGGITEAKKITGWCETHYINIAPHNPLGPVSTAACLHLDLASTNFGVQEMPRKPGTSLTNVFPVQMKWEDGYLLPPDAPGLGVEFNEEEAKKHPYQKVTPPRLHRLDGALTNW
ncbi:galactonate dehydratase [Candidatus Poribacteria bacterium]|nr:galactonate dehydratase [Candidatus Poribacteria bacterium]